MEKELSAHSQELHFWSHFISLLTSLQGLKSHSTFSNQILLSQFHPYLPVSPAFSEEILTNYSLDSCIESNANWAALKSLGMLYLTFLQTGTAEELFPLFQLKGFLTMGVPKPMFILYFSITKFCSRPCQAPGKGLKAKGTGRTGTAPHTPHCSFEALQVSIPKLQMHYCEKDATTSVWCLPHLMLIFHTITTLHTSTNTAFNALFSLIPMRDLTCLHPEIIWHIITNYHFSLSPGKCILYLPSHQDS